MRISLHNRSVFALFLTAIAIFVVTICSLSVAVATGFTGTAVFPVECGVVFGAAVHGKGNPGPGIYRRVETAASLYHAGKLQRLILTGGKGSATQESEAAVMRDLALQFGVRSADIVLEDRATSTIENIRYGKPLTDSCASVVGISDRYHLRRIQYLADRMDWDDLQTYPSERIANTAFETRSILREAFALLYTGIFGVEVREVPETTDL